MLLFLYETHSYDGKPSISPMPTVNNQQPYIACSMDTRIVDLVFLNVKAKSKPPKKVIRSTRVFL